MEHRFIASIQQAGCWQRRRKIVLRPLENCSKTDEQKALSVLQSIMIECVSSRCELLGQLVRWLFASAG